jgi:TolB-like protein
VIVRGPAHVAICTALLLLVLAVWGAGAAAQEPPAESPPEDLPRIALAPFRVHSAQQQGDLARSLAELLASSLAASGRVEVVDASPRFDIDAPVGDADVRSLARALDADYVVTGSLTELAGRYSLDVRVTPAEAGLPSYTQVWTASEEESLQGRMLQVSDRVLEQVVGAAPALVTGVEITGAAGFERELLGRLNTRAGEPYDPIAVRADLATLRSSPAVVTVEAETERSDAGVSKPSWPILRCRSRASPATS